MDDAPGQKIVRKNLQKKDNGLVKKESKLKGILTSRKSQAFLGIYNSRNKEKVNPKQGIMSVVRYISHYSL